jgi:hypothetical protein
VSKAVDEDQFIPQFSEVAHQLRDVIVGGPGAVPRTEQTPAPVPAPETPAKPEETKGIFSEIEKEQEPAPTEEGLLFKPVKQAADFMPTRRLFVDGAVMGFDIGELDGKAGAELVVVVRKTMLLYQRAGATFALKDTIDAALGEDFLKVSVGDIDANGRAEIYLVSRYGSRARTTILEWTGTFTTLDRQAGHLRALRDSATDKSFLLFQNSHLEAFLSGGIYFADLTKERKIALGDELPQMRGVQFYTLALYDLTGDGVPEVFGLGDDSRLRVWDLEGDMLWKGDKQLGGTNNAIRIGGAVDGDLSPRIAFDSRLLVTDINGDGKRELLAVKNIPLVGFVRDFKVYTKSTLIAYKIQGTDLTPAWTTSEIDYCITDLQADGPTLYVGAQKGKIERISKGTGVIMWFE